MSRIAQISERFPRIILLIISHPAKEELEWFSLTQYSSMIWNFLDEKFHLITSSNVRRTVYRRIKDKRLHVWHMVILLFDTYEVEECITGALLTMPVTYKPTNVVIFPFIRYSGTSAYIIKVYFQHRVYLRWRQWYCWFDVMFMS